MAADQQGCRNRVLVLALLAIPLYTQALPAGSADDPRLVSVPALAVLTNGQQGLVHYIVIQIDNDPRQEGPTVRFNEINLGGGSLVGEDWKDGVIQAVRAAAKTAGEDGRDWLVTVKNRSYHSITGGMSASSAVAVGVLAAWRGEPIKPGTTITGQITPDGRIEPVSSIPKKLEAAANEGFKTVLVPRGQLQTPEWDLLQMAARWQVSVIEVGTLEEAYSLMVGTAR